MRTNDFAMPTRPLKSIRPMRSVLGMVALLGWVPSLAQAFSLTTTTSTSLACRRTPFSAEKRSPVLLFARKKPTRGLATSSSSSTASSSSSFYPFSSSSSPGNSTTLLSSAAASSHHHHQHSHSHQHHETATPGPAGNVFVHDEPGPPPPPLTQLALNQKKTTVSTWLEEHVLSTYWGPRLILAALAAIYASNFNLGAVMNDHLPASSAATCARMVLAAAALAPAIPHLAADLRLPAVLCGCFTSLGYVTQSVALQDVDPARVSFLGSLTVLWCPLLEWLVDGKPMGWKDAPQTWLAAVMCLAGVAALELQGVVGIGMGSSGALSELSMSTGDGLALLQAVGFGTGVFWTARMLNNRPDQALPVTATLLATTAFNAMLWSLADGWMFTTTTDDDWMHTAALPGLLFNTDLRHVAAAVVWTGLISTSLNFYIELTVLGRVPPSEASVILASEPLWAALFAAAFMPDSSLTAADGVGGALIVGACLVNALVRPTTFGWPDPADKEEYDDDGDDYLDDDSNDKNHVVMALPTATTAATATTTTTSQTTAMAAVVAGDDELQQRQPLQMAASTSTRDTSTSSTRSRQPQVF